MLFAIQEAKKFPENNNLRKIHNQFGQHNHRRTAHRQTAKRFCRTACNWFSKNIVSRETIERPLQLFHWNSCKMSVDCFRETRRGGLVRPASKSGRFSHHPLRVPKAWHGDFAACGQRSGLLALNLANIFEKLLDQKTF